ncbi:MAG: hypothetical protein ACNA8W_09955, partial [Bradymonadaceae bacterium]
MSISREPKTSSPPEAKRREGEARGEAEGGAVPWKDSSWKDSPQRPISSLWLLILVLTIALTGCRTPTAVEGNLPPRAFATPTTSLTKDAAGLWYVVAAEGEPLQDFVVIEHGELKFAFYAVAIGQRAAQLLPLTPLRVDWYNDAMRGEASITFLADLEDVNIDGALALWAGEGADRIRWLGAMPRGHQQALIIPAHAPERGVSLPAWARGTLTFEENRVTSHQGTFPADAGPYLVFPDGIIKPNTFRVANLSGRPLSLGEGSVIQIDELDAREISSSHQYSFSLLPLGRSHLADAVVFRAAKRWAVSLVDPANARVGRFHRLEAGLAEVPWTIGGSPEEFKAALGGLHAIFDNHPLVASYLLRDLDMRVHGNAAAADLRRMELVAAAGFGSWMRMELLDQKKGVEADASIYLARSFAYEGQWQATEIYATRAYELFGGWSGVEADLGRGRASMLNAVSRAERGDWNGAVAYGRRAAWHFDKGGDVLQVATAHHHTGLYLFEAGQTEEAVAMMNDAGRKFTDGGASYFGLLTTFRLARRLVEAGSPEGTKLIQEVGAQFDEISEPIATNRAHIATVEAQMRRSGTRGSQSVLRELFDTATGQGDRIGAMAAATLLIQARRMDSDEDIIAYGTALAYGLVATSERYYSQPAHEALTLLCTRGLPGSVEEAPESAPLLQSCDSTRRSLRSDPGALPIWIASGYRHIQMGRWDAAATINTALGDLINDDFKRRRGKAAADIFFFQAALVDAEQLDLEDPPALPDEQTSGALVQQAFDVLKDALDPNEAASYLHGLSQQFRLRGLDTLAVTLARASVQAARNRNQAALEATYTLDLAQTYAMAENWKVLATLDSPPGPALAVRVDLYR